jgi:tetratricopeptide (TPR) repeat protein
MTTFRATTLTAALMGVAVLMCGNAQAVDTRDPAPSFKTQSAPAATKPAAKKKKAAPKKKQKQSDRQFLGGYRHAHDLIYRKRDYQAGIVALRRLGREDHPDVANLIGFASRKLGRSDDAKLWYEKALAADPDHTRTWQYYGMWHLEQGNRLKAEEHLEKIAAICGTACEDYKALKLALAGGNNY